MPLDQVSESAGEQERARTTPPSSPDASPTLCPSLSLAAGQRRSWLHINGMAMEQALHLPRPSKRGVARMDTGAGTMAHVYPDLPGVKTAEIDTHSHIRL